MQSGLGFSIRAARPGDLDAIVAIDDAASELYAGAGLTLELAADHPFVVEEVARWALAIEGERAHVAVDHEEELLGFVTLGLVDAEPYVDQLAVHPRAMRRGIGAALMERAFAWSGAARLWLTTYAHLPWNAPYYQRLGFGIVPEAECGHELVQILERQRAALPAPEQRVAMARPGR